MTAVKDITSGGNLDNQTTYRLRLRNPDLIGGLNFTNVVVKDQLPAGAVYVASSNSGVYDPATHTVTWPLIATISAGSSTDALTRTVTVVFPDSVFDVGSTIQNSFTAIGVPLGQGQPDTLSASHTHTITANNAAMTVDKTVSATSQEVGKSITYYFTVNNSGNVPLDSLWINDIIPAQDSVTAILVREVNAANPGRVFYQANTDASWTEVSGGPFSSMTTIPVSSLGLAPGTSITALLWTWPGVPFPFSGWSSPNRPGFTAVILATDRNGAAVVPGLVIPNVGQFYYQYNGSITNRSDTQNVTVAAPPSSEARPRTEKTRIGNDNIVPLSEVVYNIRVRNMTPATDSTGFYLFDQLMPGQYYVQFVMPPEEVLSPANAGSSDDADSDADVATGLTPLIDLAPGEVDLSWDAGLYGLVGVGNFVWYDLDQDGLQDSGESGAPDVRINLYDGDRRFLQSMVTDQNGHYYFSMLPPGSYFLEFVAPPDYAFSPRIPLEYDTNSDADPLTGRTERITLRQGKDDVTWDAGLIRASAIGNYVWLDKNQDGVQDSGEPGLADVRVDLYDAAGELAGSTQTDSSGVYWFEHLESGSYSVRVVETTLPAGVVCTTENNPMAVSVEKGERYENADFGYYLATASIGEYVWYDSDRDGIKQPTEKGLPNVILILKDENGRVLGVTQTDEQGHYVFENLLNGQYDVQVDANSLPPTYYLTSRERVITIDVSEARYYPDANFGFAETELMGCGRRIIAWYEPWYGNAQRDSTLRHWIPPYHGGAADTSLFSLYDSREAKTWEYDILLAWASGIDGFVVDWFGKTSYENTGINGLLDTAEDLYQRFHSSGFDFQIICAYDELALGRIDTNFVYLADSLLEHPAYWGKRSGERRPVFTFDWRQPRYTHADYQAAADSLLPADVYLLHSDRADTVYADSLKAGDLVYPWVQTLPTLWDIPFGLEWGKPYLEGFYHNAEALPESFRRVFSMGSVWPGFDDRPWPLGINRWISRQDTMVYHYTWEMAENTLSGHTWPWILVESWNDFNRATQIEPSTDWDYKHIVQTRDRAYRYKLGNVDCQPEYIENLGLLVPQHIRQARLAAEKYPALATQILAKTEEAVRRFFDRDFLSAISLADEASGLSMEPFMVDAVTSHSVTLQWRPAERANGYVLYFTYDSDRLQPCSYWRPDSILIGNATSYTLDSLQSNRKVYLALCAIDSVLGPYANSSWYANTLKGIQPQSVQLQPAAEEPPAQADGLALFFVAGSPAFSGQAWDNAVDGDLAGWDGTVTTRGEAQGGGSQQQIHQGPAWAIFSFSSDSLRRFNTVSIQTDNGIAEQYVRNRWASKLEVLISDTDTSATAFTSVLVFNRTSGNMTSFVLPDTVQARFVKLVIHQPNRTSGAWRQIVEFQVSLETRLAKKPADDVIQPRAYALHQNYPNPFNPTTVIRYDIPADEVVTIRVYDLSGRELETLVSGAQTAGSHEVVWNAAGYASGIYFYRIEAGSFSKLLRMLLIK